MLMQDTAPIALAGFAVFALAAFGLRAALHYRRTGTTGFVGLSGRIGSAEWLGGALFVAALAAAVAGPILQLLGWAAPLPALAAAWVPIAGLALYVVGLVATLWAQLAMGNSWRVGVDASARTALIATGPFRWVRNPIYTAMTVAMLGLTLLAPNVLSWLALATLVAGLEIHVRLVEEPYLTRMHGEHYRRYAARTGRFLPAVGRGA